MRSAELQAHLRRLIRRRREDLGLTAEALERRLQWTTGSIDRFEDTAGHERLGFLDLLDLLAALDLDPRSVIDGLGVRSKTVPPGFKEGTNR